MRGRGMLLVLGAAALVGCSFSESSISISKSVQSSSESIASSLSSLSPKSREEAYRAAVRDYTASWAGTGGDGAAFQARVADIAREHGITDWEGDRVTWRAVGEGLRKANVRGGQYEALKQAAAGGDPSRMAEIAAGYEPPR